MLKQISIENFKAFASMQEIELAPITLIYGANSSGKSSIIHSLMVLKQSLLSANLKGGVYSDKKLLDVGSYSSMVYKHEVKRNISIKLNIENEIKTKFEYSYVEPDEAGKDVHETQGFSYLKNIFVNECEYIEEDGIFNYVLQNKLKNGDLYFTKDFLFDELDGNILPNYIDVKKNTFRKILNFFVFSADEELPIPKSPTLDYEKYRKFLKELKSKNKEMEFHHTYQFVHGKLRSNAEKIKRELKKVTYLGPLRSNPKRYYSVDTEFEVSVGKEGENIAYFLNSNRLYLTNSINEWFKRFSIPYIFSPKTVGTKFSEPLIQIELQDTRNKVKVSPLDVGFGIGQILPILIEGIIRKNAIICVEQPEIHLHPKLQAELAEFFADTCDNNQWIIETHSEALMLRIQKLIRNKKEINGRVLTPQDVSILYVLPSNPGNELEGAEVVQIRLDEEGDFMDFWPEGFFEERLYEKR
ncbi:DUF3696 domain-containing protein [Acinetobacter lwoffii]|uniref:AAA family ATPase n=1 Tax=Acinetobacter lwoffii TaxID=28090 RepID=UPI00209AB3C7|nr:DUF3696 domain-containing protein [Acinetobacter lwoffii]MCO8077291.1 DUF3696 domain-containing protein [Acinetobacter lwoffii]